MRGAFSPDLANPPAILSLPGSLCNHEIAIGPGTAASPRLPKANPQAAGLAPVLPPWLQSSTGPMAVA